jgi:hypothetical protein
MVMIFFLAWELVVIHLKTWTWNTDYLTWDRKIKKKIVFTSFFILDVETKILLFFFLQKYQFIIIKILYIDYILHLVENSWKFERQVKKMCFFLFVNGNPFKANLSEYRIHFYQFKNFTAITKTLFYQI